MRRRRRATIEDLRLAIDGMPRHTKIAMLDGVRKNEITGRRSLVERGHLPDAGRPPSWWPNELHLVREGVGSLCAARLALASGPTRDRARAADPHLSARGEPRRRAGGCARSRGRRGPPPSARGAPPRERIRDPGRSRPPEGHRPTRRSGPELLGCVTSPGWAWMRLVRCHDDYERVLGWLEAEQESLEQPGERQPVG